MRNSNFALVCRLLYRKNSLGGSGSLISQLYLLVLYKRWIVSVRFYGVAGFYVTDLGNLYIRK